MQATYCSCDSLVSLVELAVGSVTASALSVDASLALPADICPEDEI